MPAAWYVLHSKPNKEDFFYGQLLANRLEVYYPCLRVKPINPRSRKIRSYFPGYLFVRIDLQVVTSSFLNRVPGSRGLVSFESQPASVPDALIAAIRHRVDQINAEGQGLIAGLKPGEVVIIQDGPFAGQEAIFDARISGNERVRVLLKILRGRQLPIELPGAQIERKKQPV